MQLMNEVPARITPPATGLPTLRLLRTLVRNPMEAWPAAVYEQPMLRTRLFGRDAVFVMDPELIRLVLVEAAESVVKSATAQRALGPVLGNAILTAEGAHWRWQRRAAAPVFRPDRIAAFVPAMLAAAERTRRLWLAQPAGAEIEVGSEMMRTTFEVILETMLSGDGSFDPAEFAKNMTASLRAMNWAVALGLLRAPGWMPYPGKRRTARNRDEFRAAMREIVARRRASRRRANDLLTLLLEAADADSGQAMSDLDIVDNLRTFVAAGHETTAQALTWSFYLLSLHRDSETRILDEVEEATGGRELLPEHVEKLSYTRQAIQEAMRLYPPAPLISRDATRDLRLGDEAVAAGTTLLIPIYALHRHRKLWRDPDEYDPDRFAPEAVKERHRYSYIPFGAGPRICIGMNFALSEATAILASLVRAVRLDLPDGFAPTLKMGITLRAGEGMRMLVRPR